MDFNNPVTTFSCGIMRTKSDSYKLPWALWNGTECMCSFVLEFDTLSRPVPHNVFYSGTGRAPALQTRMQIVKLESNSTEKQSRIKAKCFPSKQAHDNGNYENRN